jgi:hypothetical protein
MHHHVTVRLTRIRGTGSRVSVPIAASTTRVAHQDESVWAPKRKAEAGRMVLVRKVERESVNVTSRSCGHGGVDRYMGLRDCLNICTTT